MKKIIIAVVLLFLSNCLTAQTTFEEITLQEALIKAKKENKFVMVMASASWCGPCKAMIDLVFPKKKIGDYMNANIVSVKYLLDKADPDSIKNRGIVAYPTFLFFNGNGEEVSRICGMEFEFIKAVQYAISPENSWKARAERMEKDPGYTLEHVAYLNKVNKAKEAQELLHRYFATRSVKENFTKDDMTIYKPLITSISSPILNSMLKNKKEVISLIGKEEYSIYLKEVTSSFIFRKGGFHSSEKLDEIIAFVKANPDTKSGIASLVIKAKDAILAKDGVEIFKAAATISDQFQGEEKRMVEWMFHTYRKETDQKEPYAKFLSSILKTEKDPNAIETWKKLQSALEK